MREASLCGASVAAAEAGILLKAYAALKRRSSTVLPGFVVLAFCSGCGLAVITICGAYSLRLLIFGALHGASADHSSSMLPSSLCASVSILISGRFAPLRE